MAEVVYNYSRANIPLETMWTDIDYMDRRRVFTLDPQRFPLHKMRQLVDYLHEHKQHYIVMVDPAISDSGKYIIDSHDEYNQSSLKYSHFGRQWCFQSGK